MNHSHLTANILGASGYVGGELLRILLGHSGIGIVAVTSESKVGKLVSHTHPNLRKVCSLKFVSNNNLPKADILFSCLPHGTLVKKIDEFIGKYEYLVDLSADFRLKDSVAYLKWYEFEHPKKEFLNQFTPGLVEIYRTKLKQSKKVCTMGCSATATILPLFPLVQEKIIDLENIIINIATGSSGSGNKPNIASHHAERANVMRAYKPVGHRHVAEVIQELNLPKTPAYSITASPLVRGINTIIHTKLIKELDEKAIRNIYRKYYSEEPFIRIVKEMGGFHRLPEPKILTGSNFCDIGFELDTENNHLVLISALDNLVKGAAGQAVQALNIMAGFEETEGLEFPGLHPM